jgi:hypothetical protein
MNKKGVTLIELIGYLALVGIIVALFGGLMGYVVQTYDKINGEGALNNEANFIMSQVITKTSRFQPQYARLCTVWDEVNEVNVEIENCIELVIDKENVFNPLIWTIETVDVDLLYTLKLEGQNLYIDRLKVNGPQFALVVDSKLDEAGVKLYRESEVSYFCPDIISTVTFTCQKPIIYIKLVIVRVDAEGRITTKPGDERVYENRFSY